MSTREAQEDKSLIRIMIVISERYFSSPMMIGWGWNGGHGGRGYTGSGRGRGRGRWHNSSGANSTHKKYLCKDLGNNVFDYWHKAATDHMRTSWEKLVQHVGTKYGQDIINELNRKVKVNLVTQVHLTEVLVRHAIREALVRTGKYNIKEYCRAQGITLR